MTSNYQPPQEPRLHYPIFPASENQPTPVVLIVDDHEDTREMLEVLLSLYGCRVITAKDGQQALDLAEATHPDLFLMDMKMPGLDGFEVTRRLRAHPELKQVPIVAVTGLVTPQLQDQALKAGCNYCLAKPIDFALLEDLICVLTQRSKTKAALFSYQLH